MCDTISVIISRQILVQLTVSHLRHVAWVNSGRFRRRWLPADQLDKGTDDAVELVVQAGVLLDVAADDGNFQTRESFAGRAESAVVTRGAIFSAAVHALGEVESH